MVEIVAASGRSILGEGPLWSDREKTVHWLDILGQALHRLDLASGAIASWTMPEPTGWVIERRDAPGFIAGMASGFVDLTLDPFAIVPIGNP